MLATSPRHYAAHATPFARWVIVVLLLTLSPSYRSLPAADKTVHVNLLELPSSRLAQTTLQTTDRFFWEQIELREGLRDLSQAHNLSVWLDRQMDPSHLITTSVSPNVSNPTLLNRFEEIAKLIGGEVGLIENVVYFGPAGRAESLQRAAVELHDAISRTSGNQAKLRDFAWPELSTSNEILDLLRNQWDIRVDGELAHDLFHEGKFSQPSTLATQLTVLSGGFDKEIQLVQRNSFRFQQLERRSSWQANYRKIDLDLRRLSELTTKYPSSRCQTRSMISQVTGVTNFHLELLAIPQPAAAPVINVNKQIWDRAEVKNKKVEDVLSALVGSVGLQLFWSEACTAEMRSQLVSFTIEKASFDQLLAEVARASGLKIFREGNRVSIRP